MDDVMRLAYSRYGGDRGFSAEELRATVEEVAGRKLKAWFDKTIGMPGELEYGELLAWYGLRFAGGAGVSWTLEVRPQATSAQKKHLEALLKSSRPPR
jgi:predicted metalloprotease with PDZ domain